MNDFAVTTCFLLFQALRFPTIIVLQPLVDPLFVLDLSQSALNLCMELEKGFLDSIIQKLSNQPKNHA